MLYSRLILTALAAQFSLSIACQQPLSPDELGKRFVDAVNTEDVALQEAIAGEVYAAATVEKFTKPRLAAHFQKLHQTYAPLEYHHSERLEFDKPNGKTYVLHLYARKTGEKMWQDFQFYLESTSPHRIDRMVFVAEVAEPISLPNSSIEQKETLQWLQSYINKLEKETDLSGSILLAKGDQILMDHCFGKADIQVQTDINRQTLFGMASGSKMFTAIAVLQLMEKGKLKLSDKLTHYFPDFPNHDWAERTTLQHLLSHTSGIAEYWTAKNEPLMLRFADWHQYIPLIYEAGFLAEPGTESGYSNSNFMLLGKVIEIASGMDYFRYMEENILQKAKMTQSGWFDHTDSSRPLVTPYQRKQGGGWVSAQNKQFKKGSPAGGCYSNANDVLLFAKALKTNLLISKESMKLMTTDWSAGLKDALPYGLGLILEMNGQEPSYGHGGITKGVNFEFRYFPNLDVTLILFNNQDNGAYDDLRRNTIKLISGDR